MQKHTLFLPVLLVVLLSGCGGNRKQKPMKTANVDMPTEEYTPNEQLTFNEDVEAFVLDEDNDFSLFAPPQDNPTMAFNDDDFELEEADVDMNAKLKPLYYGYDSQEIMDDQYDALKQNVEMLTQAVQEGKTIVVKANRCICGSESYTRALSDKCARKLADETRNLLVENGVDESMIKIKALGLGTQEAALADESNMSLTQRKQAGDPDHASDRWAKLSVITI